jgi:hypothetical protein
MLARALATDVDLFLEIMSVSIFAKGRYVSSNVWLLASIMKSIIILVRPRMNRDDHRFFTMPDNDPLLDIYLNNKPQGAEEDDYRYPLEQSSDEEQPIDIGLFRSNEYAALKQ